jgi:hypothetical protein
METSDMATSAIQSLREIRDDESYPLPIFEQVTGQGRKGLRKARENGLKVVRVGKRVYVRGSDWNAFLGSRAAAK